MDTLVLVVAVACQAVLVCAAPTDQVAHHHASDHQAPIHRPPDHHASTPMHQASLDTLQVIPPQSGEMYWPPQNKLWKKFPKQKHLVEIVPLEQSLIKGKGKKLAYILPNHKTQANLVFESSEENKESNSDEFAINNKSKPKDDSDEIITAKINELVKYFKNKNKAVTAKKSERDDDYHVHYIVHKKLNKKDDDENDNKLQDLVPMDTPVHHHDKQHEAHHIVHQDNDNIEHNLQRSTHSEPSHTISDNTHQTHNIKHEHINSVEIKADSNEKRSKKHHYGSNERDLIKKYNAGYSEIDSNDVSSDKIEELLNNIKDVDNENNISYLVENESVENFNDNRNSNEYRNDEKFNDSKTKENINDEDTKKLLNDYQWAESTKTDRNSQENASNGDSEEYSDDDESSESSDSYLDKTVENDIKTTEFLDEDVKSQDIISSGPLLHSNNLKNTSSPAVYLRSVPEYDVDDYDDDEFGLESDIDNIPNVKALIEELSQLIEPRERERIISSEESREKADKHHHHHNHKHSVSNEHNFVSNENTETPNIDDADNGDQNDDSVSDIEISDEEDDVINNEINSNKSKLDIEHVDSGLDSAINEISYENILEDSADIEKVTEKVQELVDLSSLISDKVKVVTDCPTKNKETLCGHKSYKLTFFFNR